MVSHGNLLHNLAHSARLAGHDQESIAVSWLPVTHDMGLIDGILQPAYSGFPVYTMAPAAFLQRPARWLQAISCYRATHSGGPNFAYDLCARRVIDDDRRALDLGSWRIAFNGSEPVRGLRSLAELARSALMIDGASMPRVQLSAPPALRGYGISPLTVLSTPGCRPGASRFCGSACGKTWVAQVGTRMGNTSHITRAAASAA